VKKAGRDSSTAQADSFAGAKEEEKRRLAALLPAAGRRDDRWARLAAARLMAGIICLHDDLVAAGAVGVDGGDVDEDGGCELGGI
jgi:hypothetical protein